MKFEVLSKVMAELSSLLPGARVDRVFEAGERSIFLILHKSGKNHPLLIAADRSLPRLYLVAQKPAAAASLHPFTQYLKSRVNGGRIVSIGLLNRDRVAEIRFAREGTEYRVVFELTGSASNLIMLDDAGTILAVYYPVPLREGIRPLIPGIRYELPEQKVFHSCDKNRSDNVSGRAAGPARSISANREVELDYDRLLEQKHFASSKTRLGALIKNLSAKAERKLQALCMDEKGTHAAEEYKRAGDLILANLNSLRTGTNQAELTGFDGTTVQVVLDPKRPPAGNAEQYFKKYKKAKTGRAIIAARLRQAGEDKSFLETLLKDLEKAENESDVLPIRSKLIETGYLRIKGKKGEKKDILPAGQCFRKVFYREWEILIGKNAAGNDYITTKIAGSRDLWLHAEGLPGSHVVIRNPEKREVPPEVLKKAASLAAFYSKGRGAGKTSVTYTFARSVRKPKGAKAGLVILSDRKTIMVAPEKE